MTRQKSPISLLYRGLGLLGLLTALSPALPAATYYIDYAWGADAADGLGPGSAWKHAPGDAAATGKPATTALAPGDTVLFKGGVAYFGSLTLATSGSPDHPITYDGNTAGTYGTGRAILDGGHVIPAWQPVGSAEEVKGNPRWQELFYADIDVDVTGNTSHDLVVANRFVAPANQVPWQRIILIDGDESILPIGQIPKPHDAFFPDLPEDFYVTPNQLEVRDGKSHLTDSKRFTSTDPDAYKDIMIGFHGGNNVVLFADIKGFDPTKNQIWFPEYNDETYQQTRYSLYNSPGFIEQPGEWAIRPLGNGQSRIYLLPLRLENGQPANVAYPVHGTGISVTNRASHLRIQGFFIQRYSGGGGGINIARHAYNNPSSTHISIVNNEIRFVSGDAGIDVNYASDIVVEHNRIHHCPGWTAGIFLDRPTRFQIQDNLLDKNSGSGIRFYQGIDGNVSRNTILDHYGTHSSGLNLYEGCRDVVVEDNFIENVIAINRNADNLILRNNVVDAKHRSNVTLTFWASGSTDGTAIRNVRILNNTFVNVDRSVNWHGGLFGQRTSSPPEGLVVRGNVMERPHDDFAGALPGIFEDNIYLTQPAAQFMGTGCVVVTDQDSLFQDRNNRDFRRLPGGPLMESGASLPPPAGISTLPPPQLQGVVSRKTHGSAGTHDIELPLDGTGIESRIPGSAGHTLVLTFDKELDATWQPSSLAVSAGTLAESSISGNTLTLRITGIPNASYCTITLNGVEPADGSDAYNGTLVFGCLLGDTTGDGKVNAADINQTRSRSGLLPTTDNFRSDITADGKINAADANLAQNQSGLALP